MLAWSNRLTQFTVICKCERGNVVAPETQTLGTITRAITASDYILDSLISREINPDRSQTSGRSESAHTNRKRKLPYIGLRALRHQ